jgi:hypothetical protein
MRPDLLRTLARIALAAGAAGSVLLTLYAGRHNPSRLLITLFVLWVLSPFIGLIGALAISSRWPAPSRTTLHVVTLLIALGCFAIYPIAKNAFAFLVVPAVAWLFIAGLALVSARQSNLR